MKGNKDSIKVSFNFEIKDVKILYPSREDCVVNKENNIGESL